jgi:chromosome segregation ATPase
LLNVARKDVLDKWQGTISKNNTQQIQHYQRSEVDYSWLCGLVAEEKGEIEQARSFYQVALNNATKLAYEGCIKRSQDRLNGLNVIREATKLHDALEETRPVELTPTKQAVTAEIDTLNHQLEMVKQNMEAVHLELVQKRSEVQNIDQQLGTLRAELQEMGTQKSERSKELEEARLQLQQNDKSKGVLGRML